MQKIEEIETTRDLMRYLRWLGTQGKDKRHDEMPQLLLKHIELEHERDDEF